MRKPSVISRIALRSLCLLAGAQGLFASSGSHQWNVQYLVDQSQVVFGESQRVFPRHNRGLAISPDKKYLYAGYHHTEDGKGEVRKIRIGEPGTSLPDFTSATVKVLRGYQGKSLAVDREGRVYIASSGIIAVTDAALSRPHYVIETGQCDGVAVAEEGGGFALYASDRGAGCIRRWELKIEGGRVKDAVPAGFGGEGVLELPGALSLRGLCVDPKGRLLCADIEGNRVYRIGPDGKDVESFAVESPMGVACDGERILVTQWRKRQVGVFGETFSPIESIGVPWEELQLVPRGNNLNGALSGIVALPGLGFFVANERGQTAHQKSTYGKADRSSGSLDGKLYMDVKADDNEPILFAHPAAEGRTSAGR